MRLVQSYDCIDLSNLRYLVSPGLARLFIKAWHKSDISLKMVLRFDSLLMAFSPSFSRRNGRLAHFCTSFHREKKSEYLPPRSVGNSPALSTAEMKTSLLTQSSSLDFKMQPSISVMSSYRTLSKGICKFFSSFSDKDLLNFRFRKLNA